MPRRTCDNYPDTGGYVPSDGGLGDPATSRGVSVRYGSYLIFDRDSIFSSAVVASIKAMGTKPVRTSFRSPWKNGTAERWIGSFRREMLEYVVVLSERHLLRLARLYIDYYHEDRCHLALDKDPPAERPITPRPSPTAKVVALPRVGGLHHRYEWQEAA